MLYLDKTLRCIDPQKYGPSTCKSADADADACADADTD